MSRFDRKDVMIVLFLAGVAALSWLPRLRGPIDFRWDGGAYYVLGTSLAQGKGYRLLNEPGEIQSSLHPPVEPLIVALHQLVLRTSDFVTVGGWLRRFYMALFIAYAVAAYAMLRGFLPPAYAVPATLVCLLQLHTIYMSDLCFPEIPFGLTTLLFTLCHLKGGSRGRRVWSVPLAAVSFGLRTVGVALLGAWAVESLLRRQFRQTAGRLLVMAVLVLCWTGYVLSVESGPEYRNPAYAYQRAGYNYINVSYARNVRYKDPFSPELGATSTKDRIKGFFGNLAQMPARVAEAVSTRLPIWDLLGTEFNRRAGLPLFGPWTIRVFLLCVAAGIVFGLGLLLKQGQYLIPLYVLFSCAIICATPWPSQFNRYLTPLAPFLSLSLFLTVRAGVERISRTRPIRDRIVGLAAAGAALAILAVQTVTLVPLYTTWRQPVSFDRGNGERMAYRLFFYQETYRSTDAGLDWLKAHASPNDVLAATDPQWAYLRTGLKSVLPPFELNPETAQQMLDSVPIKYLIVDESVYRKYTAPVVTDHPAGWRRVFVEPADGTSGLGKLEIYERIGSR